MRGCVSAAHHIPCPNASVAREEVRDQMGKSKVMSAKAAKAASKVLSNPKSSKAAAYSLSDLPGSV